MKRYTLVGTIVLSTLALSAVAFAFCGFYVAKADTKLFNKASQVVIARHDDKTVVTMSNDFKGDLTEFAMVIPVPTVLEKGQIHIGDRAVIDHLDAYSAPRLVEYYDPDPCRADRFEKNSLPSAGILEDAPVRSREASRGVRVEAKYTIGEYDILILSAEESDGLERWLRLNSYRIPEGAARVLDSYIKQGMKFFVAKVNLKEQAKLGFSTLRPIQIAYESPKFMLPIRLGMVNADGPQELFVYTLTRKGRVETTNYRTVKLPTGVNLPVYIKDEFGAFYTAMFAEQTKKEKMQTLFLEYAWNMAWCDPCAADPLSPEELRKLGVFWLDGYDGSNGLKKILPRRRPGGSAQEVFITRLHVRYDADHFPEDLVFQETADRQNFQARYVLQHPWQGEAQCGELVAYRKGVLEREEREAAQLASLTGWDIQEIRRKMGLGEFRKKKWYEKLWG